MAALLATGIAPRTNGDDKPTLGLEALIAGYKFVWKTPIILGLITLDLVAMFFAGVTALLPVFTLEILAIGPWGLGVLRAMPSLGGVCAALIIANFAMHWHVGRTMIGAILVYGLATVGFGLSSNFFVGLVFLFILGAAAF